jgi:hypothetical protein
VCKKRVLTRLQTSGRGKPPLPLAVPVKQSSASEAPRHYSRSCPWSCQARSRVPVGFCQHDHGRFKTRECNARHVKRVVCATKGRWFVGICGFLAMPQYRGGSASFVAHRRSALKSPVSEKGDLTGT